MTDAQVARRAWLMVALAFVSQSVAYGMTFGMAGTFIGPAGDEFAASRSATSLGPSMVALLHGLLGPFVGFWLARHSVRTVMTTGAAMMGAAFLIMHFAANVWVFSLAFGLLGGAAVACLGITPITALVGRWFPHHTGRALGLANMPLLVTLLPPLAGYLNATYGWRTTALAAALFAFSLVPFFRLVHDTPPRSTRTANDAPAEHGHLLAHSAEVRRGGFKPDAAFWKLAVGVGILDGSGITIITHIIPYATEAGIDYQQATLLVSIMGLCGLVGAPAMGFLADRVGGARTLSLVAVLLAVGWGVFLVRPPFAGMAGAMALLGFCGGSLAALAGTTFAARYSGPSLGPAVGLSVLVALPFNFTLPLLAGFVHDRTGSYELAFGYQLGLFAIATGLLWMVAALRAPLAVEGAFVGETPA